MRGRRLRQFETRCRGGRSVRQRTTTGVLSWSAKLQHGSTIYLIIVHLGVDKLVVPIKGGAGHCLAKFGGALWGGSAGARQGNETSVSARPDGDREEPSCGARQIQLPPWYPCSLPP